MEWWKYDEWNGGSINEFNGGSIDEWNGGSKAERNGGTIVKVLVEVFGDVLVKHWLMEIVETLLLSFYSCSIMCICDSQRIFA